MAGANRSSWLSRPDTRSIRSVAIRSCICCIGYPATPEAFLNVGDVAAQEDILVAMGVMNLLIMVILSGTTGFFTDKEWVKRYPARE
jgi:hypothetical protein